MWTGDGRELFVFKASQHAKQCDTKRGTNHHEGGTELETIKSDILKDLGAEQDESVTVTLVPRHGKVRIGGVRIEYNGMWKYMGMFGLKPILVLPIIW